MLRSRFTEDRLEEAAAKGVTSYILIGAGFDSFALRQPSWARALKIVEVDHPATQAAKRERIAKAGISEPENLIFAPADFEREELGEVLARCAIGPGEPAFFSWLGVTMYLEEAAIDTTLRAIAAFAPGSRVTLTFMQPLGEMSSPLAAMVSAIEEPWVIFYKPFFSWFSVTSSSLAAMVSAIGEPWVSFFKPFFSWFSVTSSPLANTVSAVGEPFVSFFTPEEIEAKLRETGFSGIDFLTPEKAEALYFTPSRNDLPVPKLTSILCASVQT